MALDTEHALAEAYKCFLVYPVGDSRKIHLLKLELVVCHSLQSLFASILVNIPLSLEVEERKYVGDLLLREYPRLESLLLFQFQSLDQELLDVLWLLETDLAAKVLHQLYYPVLSEVFISLVFEGIVGLALHRLYYTVIGYKKAYRTIKVVIVWANEDLCDKCDVYVIRSQILSLFCCGQGHS